jgi:hypothetical protein
MTAVINHDLAKQTKDAFVGLGYWNMSWSSYLEIVLPHSFLHSAFSLFFVTNMIDLCFAPSQVKALLTI